MASELVRQLIDTGIHYGHRASRWNPKMGSYIFGKRSTIHIIDIRETVRGLLRAKRFLSQVVGKGGDVLFVGTKRQARQHVRTQAGRVGMPFVAERWLGGTLTNFATIRSRVKRLDELEAAEADGTAQEFSKKMIATRARELRKIRRNLEGIRNMTRRPAVLVVIDVHRERNAVREAKKLSIPTVCLIDTDSDPDFADLPIPGNDDAMRAIEIVLTHLADAVEEGLRARKAPPAQETPSEQEAGAMTREVAGASGIIAPRPAAESASGQAAGMSPGGESSTNGATSPAAKAGDSDASRAPIAETPTTDLTPATASESDPAR